MAFRLDGKGPLADDIRKLARGRVDAAVEVLADPRDPHESVHQARKRFKEMRALVRLFRPALGGRIARRENTWYRDHARALSGYRDAQAVIETVDALAGQFRLPAQQEALQACRQALVRRRDRLVEEEGSLAEQIAGLIDELAIARERIGSWPMKATGAAAFTGGFRRYYADGARAMQQSHLTGAPEPWHEWRKRVKDYWYHVQILRPLWPPVLKALQAELKSLSDLLGDDHDLDVLETLLAQEPEHLDELHRRMIHGMIAQQHEALRVPALRLGQRLYADRPGAVSRRLQAWWTVWREEQGQKE